VRKPTLAALLPSSRTIAGVAPSMLQEVKFYSRCNYAVHAISIRSIDAPGRAGLAGARRPAHGHAARHPAARQHRQQRGVDVAAGQRRVRPAGVAPGAEMKTLT